VRFFLLLGHYSQEVDFSDEGLRAAGTGLSRLRKSLVRFKDQLGPETPATQALAKRIEETFIEGMDDDFNAPKGIASLFEGAKALGDLAGADAAAAGHVVAKIYALGMVLGLDLASLPIENRELSDLAEPLAAMAAEFGVTGESPEACLEALIVRRVAAKTAKEWAIADGIRNRLKDLGLQLMDRPGGETAWERSEPAGVGR